MAETEVLVLGAGAAGYQAAVAARLLGPRVVLAYAGHGASPHLLGCNALVGGAPVGDSAEQYAADMLEAGGGLNDRRLVQALVVQAAKTFEELSAIGVPFPRDAAGAPLRRHLSGNSHPRSLYVPDGTGRAILQRLAAESHRLGVEHWPGWRALLLLREGDRVIGAVLANPSSGEARAVLARVVVLATGGIGRVYLDSTYPTDVAADSCALAFRAGARLLDLEFVQFEPTIVVHPEGCRGMEIPTAMLGDGAHLLNAQDERFMFRYNPAHGERFIEKARLALCIQAEIDAGRGLPDDTVWVDTTVLPRETLEGYVSHCRRLRSAGLDPATERPHIRPAAHSHMGGIRIDAEGWTGVPGLYASGEAAGGVHGASRIAGNGGATAVAFGHLVGAAAGRAAASQPAAADPRSALDRAAGLCGALATGLGPDECRQVQEALQRTMSRYAGLRRSGDGLRAAAAQLRELEGRLGAGALGDLAAFLPGLSARNMLLGARLITEAALLRTESRGAHQRTDCPTRNDEDWLRHITFRAGPGGEVVMEPLPIA